MELLLDKQKQELVKKFVPEQKKLRLLAGFFSSLSDGTRIKIISALAITSMCVNDLSVLLELNQTTLSHQLKTLRDQGVVDYRRQGKISFYYISKKEILNIMLAAADGIN